MKKKRKKAQKRARAPKYDWFDAFMSVSYRNLRRLEEENERLRKML